MKPFKILVATIFSLQVRAQTSLTDTPGLQELKRKITNTSIIGLGEVGHGYETINEAKSALVDMLRDQMNFNAISFESSFTGSLVSFLCDSTVEARARNFLYPFWNTMPVKAALKPFLYKEKDRPLVIGFDIQEDCRFSRLSGLLTDKQLVAANKDRLLACDSVLSYYIGKNFSRKGTLSQREYILLMSNYEMIESEIKTKVQEPVLKKLLERSICNRKWLCRYLTLASAKQKMHYRDSLMAENIIWLKKELYNDNNLIVWAANTHIAKRTGNRDPGWMGEWLSAVYGNGYYAVAIEKGTANKNFLWEKAFCKYFDSPDKKFNLVIYLNRLAKILPDAWITPCN